MSDLSRYLFLAGSVPFLVLGVAHALATPIAVGDRKGLSPSDANLPETMARSHLRLTKRSDMWLVWVGFNLSHSLGAVAFGAFVLVVGRTPGSFAEQAGFCIPLAVVVSGAYVGLAVKYWFRTPIIGCAASFGCFAASWAVHWAGV
jgi:hypothetical protein